MKKEIQFFTALAACIVSIYAFTGAAIPSFIINPASNAEKVQAKTSETKKKSKDEMREDVVHQSKEVLDRAVILMRRLAQVNNSCAITQNCNSSALTTESLQGVVADSSRCIQYTSSILIEISSAIHLASAAAEAVLEESAVFKKAGRKELNDVLERLKSADLVISAITYDLEPFTDTKVYQLDYKALEKNLTQHSKKIAAAIKECKGDACLKQL